MTWRESCGHCGREAPPAIEGSGGQAAQGWVTFAGADELVIHMPEGDVILPPDVVDAIRAFDGLIRLEPRPAVTAPATREVNSAWLGIACPDCQRETGWDHAQWSWFFAQQRGPDGEELERDSAGGVVDDAMTDHAKLISALLRSGLAETAWTVARMAGVDEEYAVRALRRMTEGDTDYPILRRPDLGRDVYEAIEDSAREW
jgi:hypothetical protein